jgi:type II secretory pathway component PulJ
MHELLLELKSPIAFAIIALVSLLLKRFLKGEIETHVAPLAKETRENTTQIAVMQREMQALWRYHDERNKPCDEEE